MRLAIAAFVALSAPALAAEPEMIIDQSKTYVAQPSTCADLEAAGGDVYENADLLTLSFNGGMQGYEFHCEFFDVKSRPGDLGWLLVEAICEEPGLRWPDLLSVSQATEDSIEVVSMADTAAAQSQTSEDFRRLRRCAHVHAMRHPGQITQSFA